MSVLHCPSLRWLSSTAGGSQPRTTTLGAAKAGPAPSCQRVVSAACTWRRGLCMRTTLRVRALSGGDDHAAEDEDGLEGRQQGKRHRTPHWHLLAKRQTPVGSEWGEGFLQLSAGAGEEVHLDVDLLNERLQHRGATRLRNAQRPDEAYGMIFSMEAVADTRGAIVRAAAKLASHKGAPTPLPHQQQALALRSTSPERLFIDVLGWTNNMKQARELAYDLAEAYAEELLLIAEPMPGLRDWIAALSKFNVPCAMVTSLDRATSMRVLQRMCLHDFFDTVVTGDEDFETVSQRLLSASMDLKRPPNHCVVFADSPQEITAAHNCTMKAVAVCSAYPAYNLKAADLTVGNLSELTVYNIRKLFAAQGSDFMEYCKERSNSKDVRKNRIAGGTL